MAATGWRLTPEPTIRRRLLCSQDTKPVGRGICKVDATVLRMSGVGMRARGVWVERIYYAGGAEQVWGPYTIGYLEWDGTGWVDQHRPVFNPEEEWEHGSVYEPNLVYADGKWKMWY
ncbi:MAG TPA: hypothetical protein VM715_22955, partial [Candidatus Acidoferrum sp.]|nr:hypothetical protein [Candidatus Acidoferrum sp.]